PPCTPRTSSAGGTQRPRGRSKGGLDVVPATRVRGLQVREARKLHRLLLSSVAESAVGDDSAVADLLAQDAAHRLLISSCQRLWCVPHGQPVRSTADTGHRAANRSNSGERPSAP